MAHTLNSAISMRKVSLALLPLLLSACRGEPTPRDYQNSPPAMTHPVTTSAQSPTANGMPGAAAESSSGAEGKNVGGKPTDPLAPTGTMRDQAPGATTSANPDLGPAPSGRAATTVTTSTVVTSTH